MKVRIEFDTMKSCREAKIYHDGKEQKDKRNILLVLVPDSLPAYCQDMPMFLEEVFLQGLEVAVKKAKHNRRIRSPKKRG